MVTHNKSGVFSNYNFVVTSRSFSGDLPGCNVMWFYMYNVAATLMYTYIFVLIVEFTNANDWNTQSFCIIPRFRHFLPVVYVIVCLEGAVCVWKEKENFVLHEEKRKHSCRFISLRINALKVLKVVKAVAINFHIYRCVFRFIYISRTVLIFR